MKQECVSKSEFFASANGYSGFRSYFDVIFDSNKFDKVFVLKGGPGCGKSTLMKKIAKEFDGICSDIELFRCSSDKASLDGVMLYSNGKRVAIIDGTAPHERDAVVPGVVDVLINLGEAFDTGALSDARKDILALNSRKKKSYAIAYDKLSKSCVFDSNIKAEINSLVNQHEVCECVKELVQSLEIVDNNEIGVRLFSSFSKEGYTKIDSFLSSDFKVVSVVGEYGSDCIFMRALEDELTKNGISFIKMPSALDGKTTEGIYLSKTKVAIVCNSNYNPVIETRELIKCAPDAYFEKIKALQTCKALYENEAKEALVEASKCHFELEKIYTKAVDFDIINKYTDKISKSLYKIFA